MEKSVPALADRDLYRRQDEADRISGILGIHVERASQPLALSTMDR